MLNPWFGVALKPVELGVEAQSVMALRMLRLATGNTRAYAEANRMMAEKAVATAQALTAATFAVMAGHKDHVIARKVLRVYKKRVRANKRRLTRR